MLARMRRAINLERFWSSCNTLSSREGGPFEEGCMSVQTHKVPVWTHEGVVLRTGQEHCGIAYAVCIGKRSGLPADIFRKK